MRCSKLFFPSVFFFVFASACCLLVVLTFFPPLQLRAELDALQHTVAELEKERDFYYGKLRSVELLCQTTEESPQGRSHSLALALSRAPSLSLFLLPPLNSPFPSHSMSRFLFSTFSISHKMKKLLGIVCENLSTHKHKHTHTHTHTHTAPESVVAMCKEILGIMYADNDDAEGNYSESGRGKLQIYHTL